MQGFGVIAGLLLIWFVMFESNMESMQASRDRVDAVMYAQHATAYARWLSTYARSQPAASGTIADSVAGVPSWFERSPGLTNVVQSGVGYVYFMPRTQADGFAVARRVRARDAQAGINVGGRLQVPGADEPGGSLPPAIPEGAAVIVVTQ